MSQRLYAKYSQKGKDSLVRKKTSKNLFSHSTISDLPLEVLLKIFSLLNLKSLQNASLVCRAWRNFGNDNRLWEAHFKEFFGKGTQSMYLKLKTLALRPGIADEGIQWKQEFLAQCKIQSIKVLSKIKQNPYSGVPEKVTSFLGLYNIKFQLCLSCSDEKKFLFSKPQLHSFKSTTYLQWNSLTKFPALSSIQTIQVFAISPLILQKNKKYLPVKKALVLSVEVGPKPVKQFSVLSEDVKDKLILKNSGGVLVAIWAESNDIAFVSLCLHHHNLINRCILSSLNTPYVIKHKPILDDIDPSYGMHGYQCHILIHTAETTLYENKFSYLACSKGLEGKFLVMKPDVGLGEKLNFSNFSWKTELFRGSFDKIAFVTITLQDVHREVIWAVSYPGQIKNSSTKSVSFDNSGPMNLLRIQDDQGFATLTFRTENTDVVPEVVIGLSLAKISQWFGLK